MTQAEAPRGAKDQSTRKRSEKVGTLRQRIELAASVEGPFRGMYALVDTGSAYTWVPAESFASWGWLLLINTNS